MCWCWCYGEKDDYDEVSELMREGSVPSVLLTCLVFSGLAPPVPDCLLALLLPPTTLLGLGSGNRLDRGFDKAYDATPTCETLPLLFPSPTPPPPLASSATARSELPSCANSNTCCAPYMCLIELATDGAMDAGACGCRCAGMC